MAKLGISTGTNPNDGSGDSLLAGAVKINSNFNEVYAAIGNGSTVSTPVTSITAGDNIIVSGSTGSVTITGIGTADIDTDRINVSGVVTASSFSGSGVNLTNLPSSALVGTLPAVSGANLTGIATFIDAGANITVTTGPTGVTTIASSSGSATTSNVSSNTLVVTGVSTLGITSTTSLTSQQLNVSGVSTFTADKVFFKNGGGTPATLQVETGAGGIGNTIRSSSSLVLATNGSAFNLNLDTDTAILAGGTGASQYTSLYGTGAERLKTAGYGVTVTGTTFTNQLNVTGVSTFNGGVFHPDLQTAYFGNSNDLQIYHQGGYSMINNNPGGGSLYITGGNISDSVVIRAFNEDAFVANFDGGTELYYDGTKKFETTGYGITVSGGVYASGISTICNTLYIHPAAGPDNQHGIILKGQGGSDGGEINLTGPNSTDSNSTYYSNIRLNKTGGGFKHDLEFHSNGYTSGDIGDFVFYRRQTSSQRTERMKLTGEDGNLIISGTSSGGIVSATSYTGDGSELADGKWTLGANGTSDYTFTGIGLTQTTNDPILYLARGRVYEFVNSMGAHPFEIRQSAGGSAYNSGVTNNAVSSGTLRFEIPFDAPNTLYYQCTSHAGMGSTIVVYPNTI